jgi:periplasmic divalent cation tolerance protein
MNTYQLILNTCPDSVTAETIATLLVDNELAACVNILPGIRSVYHWQGQRHIETEQLLLIKSCASAYADIETTIRAHHPYELPEIIAISIDKGLPEYLAWIHQQSHRKGLGE